MKKIIPGKGTDKVKFGMAKDDVIKVLGQPTEIEHVEGDEEEMAVQIWHYDEEEMSLSFENIGDEILFSIAVSSTEWTLGEIIEIGMEESNISELLEKLDLGEYEVEDMSDDDDPNQQLYFYPDWNISLWFDNGVLSEIQWGPKWDEKSEDFIWP